MTILDSQGFLEIIEISRGDWISCTFWLLWVQADSGYLLLSARWYTGKNILAFFTLAEVEYPCVFLQEWFECLFCIARLSFAGLCIPGFWTLLLYYSVGLEAVASPVMLFARMTKGKSIDMRLSAHHTWWPDLFARWNVISWLYEVLVLCSSLCLVPNGQPVLLLFLLLLLLLLLHKAW